MRTSARGDDTTIPDDPNPFNPGFGVDPPYVAGRAGIIHRLLADLNDGPGRASYLNVVVGSRGVGKTVLLNRLQQHVEGELTWPVLRWTAGPDASFAAALADELEQLLAALHRARRGRLAGGKVGVSAGVVSADIELAARDVRPTTVGAMLRRLGEHAQERGKHVVLLVDEVQAGNAASLRALSSALQETNGARLPVGLVAVGLPTTSRRLRDVDGITFLERLRPIEIGNLDDAATRDAIVQPILDAVRRIDDDAVQALVEFCGGYPYAIQLAAHHAWDATGAARVISLDHARAAIELAGEELDDLYEARWDRLSPVLQEYLVAVVDELDAEGRASTGAVARRMERPVTQVAKQRDALIVQHQLLQPEGRGFVSVALPGMTDWVRRRTAAP